MKLQFSARKEILFVYLMFHWSSGARAGLSCSREAVGSAARGRRSAGRGAALEEPRSKSHAVAYSSSSDAGTGPENNDFIWISSNWQYAILFGFPSNRQLGILSPLAIQFVHSRPFCKLPKPSENEAPDPPKIDHKLFKRISYRACPFSRPLWPQ